MKEPRLAVFDCDGTLVDSLESIVRSMATAFETHGFMAPSPADVRRVVGLPLQEAIARLGGLLDESTVQAVRRTYSQYFFELRTSHAVSEPLYPGVAKALDGLESDGWLLGIATGKARRGLEATLKPHGLADRFVTKQTSDVAAGKPNPDMLIRAMAETGADAESTVMIGDTVFDIQMARNAGTWAVGVAWGYHEKDELSEAGAHIVIDRFDDLIDGVRRMMEAR